MNFDSTSDPPARSNILDRWLAMMRRGKGSGGAGAHHGALSDPGEGSAPTQILRRLLEPESGAETAGLVGAGFVPGVGEVMDAGEIALGIADRDPLRAGLGSLGFVMGPFGSATGIRAGGKASWRAIQRVKAAIPNIGDEMAKRIALLSRRIRRPEDMFDPASVDKALDSQRIDHLMVGLHPDEYRRMSPNMDGPSSYTGTPYEYKRLVESLESGEKIRTLPYLNINRSSDGPGQMATVGHEGRHRVRLAEAMGIDTAPVTITGNGLRGSSELDEWASTISRQAHPGERIPTPIGLSKENVEAMLAGELPTRVSSDVNETMRFVQKPGQYAEHPHDGWGLRADGVELDFDGPHGEASIAANPLTYPFEMSLALSERLDPSLTWVVSATGDGPGSLGYRGSRLVGDRLADAILQVDPLIENVMGYRTTGMGRGHIGKMNLGNRRPVRRYAGGGAVGGAPSRVDAVMAQIGR